ncbi:MAG: DEAD/DEAH box helicase [Lachnospiraceae bacterium]|nr:DEAD/DEAH box helicase [Lachnospiraceae bacterium]
MSKNEYLRQGLETAFIDGSVVSNPLYTPQFVSNNYKEGKKVFSSIEDELLLCDQFCISVAFITFGGIEPLLLTLRELEKKGVKGQILTTNYLYFSEPKALEKLNELSNITLKMYDVELAENGFHTKGYIFKKEEIYRIIIGSSNMTKTALTTNREWNTKIVSTEQGEMVTEIINEFNDLWTSEYATDYDEFIEIYKEKFKIIKHQREVARQDEITSLEKYKLQPNSMQVGFITNLRKIIAVGGERALLISATGTGKTYASAFAMRELGFKRVLFLVHRGQLARQTKKSYEKVFNKSVSMGLVGAGYSEYDKDYVFATVQTLSKDDKLLKYSSDYFDAVVLDEAHHVPAETYQRIMKHFRPKLWLGMTATPDKRDDNIVGRNVYELFNYNIAYEIRLQQAMEEDLLCPFHYFGISDLSVIDENITRRLSPEGFALLTSDERVKHIVDEATFFSHSGNRVKGIIFCSSVKETEKLSEKLNEIDNPETGKRFRTIALNGSASEEEREDAFERLAIEEDDDRVVSGEISPLDYILSRDILNEGVDIVEVNQVIMLRPTESPIVFIQQLGRGLRKADGKEFVVVLDFIGNYNKNFMIPIALSGDRTYNKDNIRKQVISGNNTIPGASTIHFDEISKNKIFESIDKIKGLKSIIRDSYTSLKNRIGRIPYLLDFYDNGEVDPLVIVKEYKTYYDFLMVMEPQTYQGTITEDERLTLDYLSKTILSGVRPYELLILQHLIDYGSIDKSALKREIKERYDFSIPDDVIRDASEVLQGKFVTDSDEAQKYKIVSIVEKVQDDKLTRMEAFSHRINHLEFYKQVKDLISVGLKRFDDKYIVSLKEEIPFVLYEKYSRRDVCHLMNFGKDISSTMYGMKRIGDDVFIFVTYHKKESEEGREYVDGKPDYADEFENNTIFMWDSQMGRGIDSSYMSDVLTATRKHLLVKKSDAEQNYYYVGQFDVDKVTPATKKDNKGKMRDIAKCRMKMRKPVREDLLRYLQSDITSPKEKAI